MLIQKEKIVIVDDNEAVCQSLKFLLNAVYDIQVDIYHNPLLFLENYSSDSRGCLLIDLFMPFMNGIDLLKELNRRLCRLPIIILSGHGAPTIESQSLNSGAYAFFSKPFKIEELLACINRSLSQ
jgi:FixJ family two-component response regulator